PPQKIVRSERCSASRSTPAMAFCSSPTMVFRWTWIPASFNRWVRYKESVSTLSGVNSSEPTAMISAFIAYFRIVSAQQINELQHKIRIDAGQQIVRHNTHSIFQWFQPADRIRLPDIKKPEGQRAKYKVQASNRQKKEGDQLSGDLINHDERRVFLPGV